MLKNWHVICCFASGSFLTRMSLFLVPTAYGHCFRKRDEVGHLILVDEPVAGGEVAPRLPLFRAHLMAYRFEVRRVVHRRCFLAIHLSPSPGLTRRSIH